MTKLKGQIFRATPLIQFVSSLIRHSSFACRAAA
jgi:hypothetical protein